MTERHARYPKDVLADLRTDHAGETGAVWIYRGVLAVTRDPGLTRFARRHLATEKEHLAQMNALVPDVHRSRLLGAWRVAGFMTGALPALVGPRAVYQTIEAVETFVDEHYARQLERLEALPQHQGLKALLANCQADEQHHRDEARALASSDPATRKSIAARMWCALVGSGSRLAVRLAYRI